MSAFTRSVAFDNFPIKMVSYIDFNTPKTGKSPVVTISKDGGSFQSISDTPVEIGNGWYRIDLSANEMNASVIIISCVDTECAQNDYVIFPETS